jgi:hypothetical protein
LMITSLSIVNVDITEECVDRQLCAFWERNIYPNWKNCKLEM